ncbi:MAG: ABC transporter ATP-binding protein [Planctomycetales bacterium]|nr:ABC transporter ATP-binding protein [Planctomycetales bacterium]
MAHGTAAEIRVSNATLGYDSAPAVLEGLSLHVRPGEIVAIVGASGCGKSTLLRAIAGLSPVRAGHIEVTCDGQSELAKSYVFQDSNLLSWRTAAENVSLPLELGRRTGLPSAIGERQTIIDEALASVGLDSTARNKFPRELSGGMRMRVSLARALVIDPQVLLLDEPFAALDDLLRSRMNDLVLELHQRRLRTMLFVTHNIAEAVFLSHRVVVLGASGLRGNIANPLPWPRTSAQRSMSAFAEFYGQVSATLAEAQC